MDIYSSCTEVIADSNDADLDGIDVGEEECSIYTDSAIIDTNYWMILVYLAPPANIYLSDDQVVLAE